MIIIKLTSGLGNQLFQYAAARNLSLIHNCIIKLDTHAFGQEKNRHFELDLFNIQAPIASARDLIKLYPIEGLNRLIIKRIFGSHISYRINNLLEKRIKHNYFTFNPETDKPGKLLHGRILAQRFNYFDPEITHAPNNIYMIGYFQCEKYFIQHAETIRREFTFKNPPDAMNKEFINKITSTESIAIHIRRGDYINVPENAKNFNVCTMDYYNRAIEFIVSRITHPVFYVFSDDISWCKDNFRIKYPVRFADINQNIRNAEDLRLISYCKHQIIANSSFSWWGAWLNTNPQKIVIAPRRWNNIPNYNTSDIVPEKWVKI